MPVQRWLDRTCLQPVSENLSFELHRRNVSLPAAAHLTTMVHHARTSKTQDMCTHSPSYRLCIAGTTCNGSLCLSAFWQLSCCLGYGTCDNSTGACSMPTELRFL